jgi:hypothetical protein
MSELSQSLKLYLRYPAEMEYWYWYGDDKNYSTKDLLISIAGRENQEDFIEKINSAYESARKDFELLLVSPVRESIKLIAKNNRFGVSSPRTNNSEIIREWGWEFKLEGNELSPRVRVGMSIQTLMKDHGKSAVGVWPWVWSNKRERAEEIKKVLSDFSEKKEWDPICLAPAQPEEMSEESFIEAAESINRKMQDLVNRVVTAIRKK